MSRVAFHVSCCDFVSCLCSVSCFVFCIVLFLICHVVFNVSYYV